MNAREALSSVYEKRGQLSAAVLVEEASRSRRSAAAEYVHSRLEWDDSKAGHEYRLIQAQELIREVEVVRVPGAPRVRAWVSVEHPEKGSVYEPVEVVAEDPFLSRLTLQRMEREWKSLKDRYGHLEEFFSLVGADLRVAA